MVEAGLYVAGRITRGKTVRLGYLRQSDTELDPALTPREAVTEVRGTLDSAQGAAAASQLLDQLGLRGDTQWTPAGELSGGERRRLQLLRILLDEPNVLFLDEPTNDLDVDTLTELEDLLDGWPGSLVLVSHDRYFLERVTDHVLALLGDGRLGYLPGGVDEYLERRRAAAAAGPGGPDSPAAAAAGGQDGSAAATAAGPRPGSAATQRAARKEMQRLERQIERLSTREAELTAELAANASDYVRLTELGAQLKSVQQEKGRLEDEWLAAAEESGLMVFASGSRLASGASSTRSRLGQGGPVGGAEPVQQRLLVLDEVGQGGVHPGPAGRGQRDQHAAPVLRVRLAADQSGGGQPVHPVGHRAGGDQGGPEQCPGRELIRRSLPAQRGQHVEFPGLQAVCGERGAPGQVQVPGQPGDPAEHLERLHVQVGPLGPPGGDQVVHLVARLSGAGRAIIHARSISLDIKRVSGQHRIVYLDVKKRRGSCDVGPRRLLAVRQ